MIWFGFVWFYGISTIVGYLMPNPLYTYILSIYIKFVWVRWHINYCRIFNGNASLYIYLSNIYDLVWVGLVLWHINHCRLFNAKSSLYIYIKYLCLVWLGLWHIKSLVGYLMVKPLYTYILGIHVWFVWVR